MKPEQLDLLNSASSEQLQTLHIAHWRYMSLARIVFDVLPAVIVASDRKAYPQFCRHEDDLPVFNEADCVQFMAQVTQLAPPLCEAWMKYNHYDLHRETPRQAAAWSGAHGGH